MQVLPPAAAPQGAAAHQRQEQPGHQERAGAAVHRRQPAHARHRAGQCAQGAGRPPRVRLLFSSARG